MGILRFSAHQYEGVGNWVLLGMVPLRLAYVGPDGSELDDGKIVWLASGESIPDLKQRTWPTFQDLIDSVTNEGFTRQKGQLGFEGFGAGVSRIYEKP